MSRATTASTTASTRGGWSLKATRLLLCAAVLLTACTGDDSAATPGSSSSSPPTSVAQSTSAGPTVSPTTTNSIAVPSTQPVLNCVKFPAGTFDPKDVPAKVADTARSILAAVATCDAARLTELGGPQFRSSFGGDRGDPVPYWVETKYDIAWVKRLLSTGAMLETFRDRDGPIIEEYYVWPAAAASKASAADWKAAEALYPPSLLSTWRAGGGYPGRRLMIRPDGQWWGLLEGD